jgi:hypothetical protein
MMGDAFMCGEQYAVEGRPLRESHIVFNEPVRGATAPSTRES